MHPSTPYLHVFPHPLSLSPFLLGSCEESKLRKSVAEKANHPRVTLTDMLWENKIPDTNIFVECVKEIVQKLCE